MPAPIVSFASALIRLWLASAAVVAGLLAVVALTAGAIAGAHLATCACAIVLAPLGVLVAWRVGGDV